MKFSPKIETEFVRNIATIMTGTVIAQCIPFAMLPILTRLYSPSEFGQLAIFVAIALTIGSLSSLRYELAIVQTHNDYDAASIAVLSFILVTLISLTLLVVIFVFNDFFLTLLGNQDLELWLYFVPLSLLFTGLFKIFNFWHIRKKNFKNLAMSKVNRSFGASITQVGLKFLSKGSGGLILGYIIGELLSLLTVLKKITHEDKKLFLNVKFISIKKNVSTYKNLPKYSSFGVIADNTSSHIPVFFFSKFFDFKVAGFFSLAFKVLNLPITLISGSISEVLYQKISDPKVSFGKLKKLITKLTLALILMTAPLMATLFLAGEDLFAFVFGDDWRSAGEFASILVFGFAARFIVNPLSVILTLKRNIKLSFIWQIVNLISIILTLVCFLSFSIEVLVYVLTIQNVISYIFYYKLILIGLNQLKNNY